MNQQETIESRNAFFEKKNFDKYYFSDTARKLTIKIAHQSIILKKVSCKKCLLSCKSLSTTKCGTGCKFLEKNIKMQEIYVGKLYFASRNNKK
jgi:hypothetical protein